MALLAGEVIRLARMEHPAFTEQVIPFPLALRFLDQAQSQLALLAYRTNPHWLTVPWFVHLRRSDNTTLIGAGTTDGWPVTPRTTTLIRSDLPADSLIALDPDTVALTTEQVVASGTDLSLTITALAASTDQYLGKVIQVLKGAAEGQMRIISTNSSTVVSWTEPMNPAPAVGDIVKIMTPTWVPASSHTVMQGLTGNRVAQAFYAKVLADGTVTVDCTQPLEATIETGAPLPPNYAVTAAWAHGNTGSASSVAWRTPMFLTDTTHASVPQMKYSVYLKGGRLLLGGDRDVWKEVDWIELGYCPVPPASRTLTAPVLFPVECQEMLVAELAANMGVRAALAGVPDVDPSYFSALRERARGDLTQLTLNSFMPYLQTIVETW